MQIFLKNVHIENFRSLRDVELPLKPLTVLVGPNASGKSNVLKALALLKIMVTREKLPLIDTIRDSLWAGGADHISFQVHAKMEEAQALYELKLKAETDKPFAAEKLLVDNVQVISIQNGQGVVQDEDGKNETRYKSNKLALKSAGDYGDKPVTSILTEFLRNWEFHDFRPELIRQDFEEFPFDDGTGLARLLLYWHENNPGRFHRVRESLEAITNFRIGHHSINGDKHLDLLEGYKNPIPLERASDGTLRLVVYYTLLNDPTLPPLIAIEEPERNLHPGALTDIANVLEQIAERTQVIITTHSSQLLDAFNFENLSDSLGILLLHNRPGHGTEVINLEEIRRDQAALDGWITDFGIGSALFDSELLQDLRGE